MEKSSVQDRHFQRVGLKRKKERKKKKKKKKKRRRKKEEVSKLFGALSPVNHTGLKEGKKEQRRRRNSSD